MRALSIQPDYAWEILTGEKIYEYRTWYTKHRGDLLICTTAKKIPGYISRHAICVVQVTDVIELEDGTYAWKLEKVRMIQPFYVKGQQGLYSVEDQKINYVDHPPTKKLRRNIHLTEPFQRYYQPLID